MAQTHEDVWAIGLDVGGTKIAGGLVKFPAAEVVRRQIIPTRAERGPEPVLNDVATLALDLSANVPYRERFAGIGIGVPELVDPQGHITSAQTIDWRRIPLTERLADIGPVRVDADVRAAALAEARFGAGRPYSLFAYVSVGTGISSTLVQDGRPYTGARGNALVLASGPVTTICPNCDGLVSTALEELASGPALVRRYNLRRASPAVHCEDVLKSARQGDPDAVRVVREAGEALGSGVGFLVNVLDPEALVVGGGLGLAEGLYWDNFLDSLRRHIWADASRMLPVLRAGLGTDAGLIGAAALAINSLLWSSSGLQSRP